MSRFVKGSYMSTANRYGFENIMGLKDIIQNIAGLDQNDMTIDEEDLQSCEYWINNVKLTLDTWFENKLESLTYLGDDE